MRTGSAGSGMAKSRTTGAARNGSTRTGATKSKPPGFEIDAAAGHPLGMPTSRFLRDCWQKQPLLIRNAFPDFVSPIQSEDLAGLACEEGTSSRIIVHDRTGDAWPSWMGPFDEALFPDLPHRDWMLQVEGVDKWDRDVAALLDHFAFLPRWRIDGIAVSFAAPGGSAGAQAHHHDLFLVQAQGPCRWAIDASATSTGKPPSVECRADVEFQLLREFHPTHDWLLRPGDLLYLPPGVPHRGVAEDACLTFSVKLLAPSAAELLADFVDTLAADADEGMRYRDPDLSPPADPAEIDTAAMRRAIEALNALRMNDPDRLGDWFGRFITRYGEAGRVMAGPETRSRIEIEWDLQRGAALLRHPYSRMAWRRSRRGARLYVNGRDHALPVRDARIVANAGQLDGATYAMLSQTGRDCVYELTQVGHYQLAMEAGEKE